MSARSGEWSIEEVHEALDGVHDPELPFVRIRDLGIVRWVEVTPDGHVTVDLTPTYSGCPATETIEGDVERALYEAGFCSVRVRRVLSPAWTTDWMTEAAREALRAHGIAPPTTRVPTRRFARPDVVCPRCGATDTHQVSAFGSTACKALYRCDGCLEPFDHFKCL